MDFADLYKKVELAGAKPATFEFLREAVIEGKPWLEEVKVWRLTHRPHTGEARYTLFDDRSSAYEEEFLVADISYCSSLEADPPELLFALVKELMHVFDDRETWIDSREKFVKFIKDLQNTPLDMNNHAVSSEHMARWMAILVLCPKNLRDIMRREVTERKALESELHEKWGLPDWLVTIALDDYYDTAHHRLLS